uniref:UPF0481 protein At3g47200-like n=1 Tax=Fragaria vesca subsp. vesca TaxID=101020 RepID=UPI0005CA3CFA|nr:PREDICTED: UPF0481 protein At3g47200-like [Fragaria vesca subsp. vesca]
MGKGNHIFASRWFILQKITSTCKRRFHESLSCTTLPTFDAKILARGFHEVCGGGTSLTEELEDILDPEDQGWETSTNSVTCIYRVPSTMRQVNRKAFDPSIVSIGPYHYGVESLQEMEKLKHTYFRRLFQPNYHNQLDDEVAVLQKKKAVNDAKKAMEELEAVARSCYSEQSKLNSKEFVKMMLIDGCFIIGLLRDSLQSDFEHTPSIIQRWMLPTLRRDLIKLENQLPLFVLRKLFQLTQAGTTCHEKPITGWELEALALRFFKPLLRGHDDVLTSPPQHYAPKHCQSSSIKHFLDLFHHRISPDCSTRSVVQVPPRGKQTKQILSIQELKEAGVKLKFTTDPTRKPLDITFGRGSWCWGKVLTIPRIHIADHRGTLFRNMVAFEKCNPNCHQDVTSYLFFLDNLINSAKDVGILHYYGVLHHSLGSNREVAKLVNNLCKEVSPDVSKSYLYKVVRDVDEYYGSKYGKIRGFLVHHHFSSWLVGISTLAACLALYLALVQTGSSVASARERLHEHTTFKDFLKEALLYGHISKWGLGNARNLQQKAVVNGSTENINHLPRIHMQYCVYYLV